MGVLVPIVEGDGEVTAFPVLLRRIAGHLAPGRYFDVAKPIRVRRDRFVQKNQELRRILVLAAAKAGVDGGVIVLLDADDDCPAQLGPALAVRVAEVVPHRRSAVVLAHREYEAWFIAACGSLQGVRGFDAADANADECEVVRDAKGWVRRRMRNAHYSPVADQAAFSERIDIEEARSRSRSFRKLLAAFEAVW